MDTVYDYLEKIANTSSKNEKTDLLVNALADCGDKMVLTLKYAYDPFITFGIEAIPDAPVGSQSMEDMSWDILDKLASRSLTGDKARKALFVHLSFLSAKSQEVLKRIIRKNLLAGIAETTINKVCPGLIPEFSYMRCSLPKDVKLDKWPWEEGVVSQEKADSMFANLDFDNFTSPVLRSRQGQVFNMAAFGSLVSEVQRRLTSGYQYHGEILVERDGKVLPREEGNGVLNSVNKGGKFSDNDHPVFLMWDMIPLRVAKPKGSYKECVYRQRVQSIIDLLDASEGRHLHLVPTRVVRSLKEAYEHASELMLAGKEGTVIKHPMGTWADGTSKHQVKLKLEFDCDLEIRQVLYGKVGTKLEGKPAAFRCVSWDEMISVDVTIKNEALRKMVATGFDLWPGRIIEVTANDVTQDAATGQYSLYLPRMKSADYRADKFRADTLDRILASMEAAKLGQKLKAGEATT